MKKPAKKAVKKSAARSENKPAQLVRPAHYDPASIETRWQKIWAAAQTYKSTENSKKDKFYVLDMFPYPSGEGLHVGHPKGYIATDVISRMNRMQGRSVLHPMGFDAFGLPAENYAIKTKTNPAEAVKKNVARYKKQLEILGLDYDWSREVNTTDPEYYRWTQWTFLQMLKKGLAFESYEPVNWCPTDKTVLANEDIEDGRCERCGTPVEKKPLRQWVLKITDYADRMLADLDATTYVRPKVVDDKNPHRPGFPIVERNVVHVMVFDPRTKKYLIIRNKKHGWDTIIIGGIEDNESPEEAARREVREETGYIDLELKRTLGGPTEGHYFTKHKGQNRIAYAQALYFELKSDKRVPIADGEDKDDEILWIDSVDFVPGKMVNSELPIWLERLKDPTKGVVKPLLEWPESIKEAQRNWIGRSEGAEIDFRLSVPTGKIRFALIHGYKGSVHDHFFPWYKAELEKLGYEVQAFDLPNADDPKESEQVDFVLKNYTLDENTVVVAHSLGCVVALKALMKSNRKISGLVLVAPAFDPEYLKRNMPKKEIKKCTYWKDFSWDFDFKKINQLAQGRIAVLSDLNETTRAPYLKQLAGKLSAKLVETHANAKHFCSPQEPELIKAVTPTVTVFTTRPDTLFGVTYLVLAPEHPWVKELLPHLENKAEVEAYISNAARESEIERTAADREKTGVELKGVKAVNPVNREEVPVWIADYVLADYGTGAVMAVPAHDDRDYAFAKKFGLAIKNVVAATRTSTSGPIAFHPGEPVVNRRCIRGLVKHWSEDKYIVLKWKQNNWNTLISGGIEEGEDPIKAAMREIEEETGYTDLEFKSFLGGPINAKFYAPHKKQNRDDLQQGIFFVLKSGANKGVSDEEKKIHDITWNTFAEAKELTKESLVDSILMERFEKKLTAYTEDGVLIDSGSFTGKNSEAVKKEITAFAGGRWVTKYKLRDWVFSRQRYWGEPIPVIHCAECGVVPVPEKDLPVILPKVTSYEPTGTGESPLAAIKKWVNVKCPQCKGPAKRETNTMPQWAGSCWYYLRYMDPKGKKQLVDPKKEKYWAPVDFYVGGAEHATRHLIYARFWHKFLYDIGVVSTIEPFKRLQSVGLIMGEDGRKMSKRFGNVINPDDIVKQFGADTLRLYEMFMGPFDQQIAWSTDSMVGARRFIERVWKLREKITPRSKGEAPTRLLQKAIKKVSDDIGGMRFNTAISTLMITLNELEKQQSVSFADYETLLKLLAPFAPHVTEELWMFVGNKGSVHLSSWPVYDPALAAENEVNIIVQINGKVRGSFKASTTSQKDELERAAKELPETKKWLEGKTIGRIIVVPGRLVNIVLTD